MTTTSDVIIIGASAAGLMCAIQAGYRGRSVIVLDHANKSAKKIRISGGGRCNFTNINTTSDNYISNNPSFCISALKRYTPSDFIDWIERHDIAYHEKTLGQLFCDHKATDIVEMLHTECDWAQARIQLNTDIIDIAKTPQGFQINTSQGEFNSQSLVIATGGLSIPKMGASSFGLKIAEQFNIPIITPQAALVPLHWPNALHEAAQALSGISFPAQVRCKQQTFEEAVLLTHRGLSGPAILQISSYWEMGDEIHINCLPNMKLSDFLREHKKNNSKAEISTLIQQHLPKRFVQHQLADLPLTNLASASNTLLDAIDQHFHNWTLKPSGSEGYRTAEVMRGGVDTAHLSSKTMQANDIEGLYFIGEVVDVTGHLGGYNFQWAWASGFCAGQYA